MNSHLQRSLIVAFAGIRMASADAPIYEPLASFGASRPTPMPGRLFLHADGDLYGNTARAFEPGGANRMGFIYKVSRAGEMAVLAHFTNRKGETHTGKYPIVGLTDDGRGFFWGTTPPPPLASPQQGGTVFKVNGETQILVTVAKFTGTIGPNPGRDASDLVYDGEGALWGTTYGGGIRGRGTLFKIDVVLGELITLAEFTGRETTNRGSHPAGGLVLDGIGYLWGVTVRGGATNAGTLFKVHAQTGALTTVLEFSGLGANPEGPLARDTSGNLWGITKGGGYSGNAGTVFKVDPQTGNLTTLHEFRGDGLNAEGRAPRGGLVSDGSEAFWGVTSGGGTRDYGTVFKIDTETGALVTLAEFDGSSGSNGGGNPDATLVYDGVGRFWGTTFGIPGPTIFTVDAFAGNLTTVVHFPPVNGAPSADNGVEPAAGLVEDETGKLWGTTSGGGSMNLGTIFRIDPNSNVLTPVLEFTGSAPHEGGFPESRMVRDNRGNLWGSTPYVDGGTVYRIRPASGEFTTVARFTTAESGNFPNSLLSDGTGNLWGTTRGGGTGNGGTVFKLDASTGIATTLARFTYAVSPNLGAHSAAGLAPDGRGYFWGTTFRGNAPHKGTIFRIKGSTGLLETVLEFTGPDLPNKGARSSSVLVADGVGNLWGTTRKGGAMNLGTVFKINAASGVFATVAEFTGIDGLVKGAEPRAGLVLDRDGSFYGTTASGGTNNYGTVFRITSNGLFTTVFEFTGISGSVPGQEPEGDLLLHSDGHLYGTTRRGGAAASGLPSGGGQIFRIRLDRTAP